MKFAWIFVTLYLINGFTLGDELGFNESLSNLEGNKRRSTSARGPPINSINSTRRDSNRIVVQNAPQKLPKVKAITPVIAVTPVTVPTKKQQRQPQQLHVTAPPFKPIPSTAIDPKLILGATRTKTRSPIPDFQAMPASVVQAYTAAQMPDKVPEVKLGSNLFQRVMNTNITGHVNMAGLSPAEADIIARKQALKQKQAMILAQQQAAALTSTTTTTTTTTAAPIEFVAPAVSPVRTGLPASSSSKYMASKVMNAPKEYYPVGYDKNFDDNFVSRVELPETSFYCGDQKHFPGLYADEDLGCMVFHVCALTDDGLIMKSFLCPESTLFDQTILKCNWWFYVDCKNSKSLYDSNIPISKSYQLMKALTFFSSIKKDATEKN